MKTCTVCHKEKEPSQFHKRKNSEDGLYYYCKDCRKQLENKYREKNKKKIAIKKKEHHQNFPWKRVLLHIKQRCNNPKSKQYNDYGGRGIKCLITEEELKFLWFRDKAYLLKIPSIDRINNDSNYCLENCKFIELKENSAKDKRKPILQFDLSGNFIKEWESQQETARTLDISQGNIGLVCKGKRHSAGKFIWKFKN